MLFKRLTAHPWDSPPPPGADKMLTGHGCRAPHTSFTPGADTANMIFRFFRRRPLLIAPVAGPRGRMRRRMIRRGLR